jgi:epoxide hydrolase-like predicted phosphatase
MAAKHMPGARDHNALLLDFGGVLTTSVWDSFADFCREHGLDGQTVKRLFREDPEALADLRALEIGALTESQFERRFADRLGLDSGEDLIDSMFRGMRPEPRMVEATTRAREAGVRTALVSNSWSTSHYDRDFLGELFNELVISGEVGLYKPQREIYQLAAARLEVGPKSCVFVDDLRENCEGAEAVGMTVVRHRSAEQTIAELEELFGIRLVP